MLLLPMFKYTCQSPILLSSSKSNFPEFIYACHRVVNDRHTIIKTILNNQTNYLLK